MDFTCVTSGCQRLHDCDTNVDWTASAARSTYLHASIASFCSCLALGSLKFIALSGAAMGKAHA
eukprot:6187818-Pleurochrysis_carterae.AAC.1